MFPFQSIGHQLLNTVVESDGSRYYWERLCELEGRGIHDISAACPGEDVDPPVAGSAALHYHHRKELCLCSN